MSCEQEWNYPLNSATPTIAKISQIRTTIRATFTNATILSNSDLTTRRIEKLCEMNFKGLKVLSRRNTFSTETSTVETLISSIEVITIIKSKTFQESLK